MLPIIAFDREIDSIRAVREAIDQAPEGVRVLSVTRSAREAARFLWEEGGILLVVCGVCEAPSASGGDDGLKLARMAQKQNRESYVILTASSLAAIEEAMSGGIRVSGVMIRPVRVERAHTLIERVLADYNGGGGIEKERLSFKVGGSVVRITPESLLYVEACGKKLELWTTRQRYSVYGSLNELEKSLGEAFVRCHRSYLANVAAIERADYTEMEIYLAGGARLPLARSQTGALRERLGGGKEDCHA